MFYLNQIDGFWLLETRDYDHIKVLGTFKTQKAALLYLRRKYGEEALRFVIEGDCCE